MTTLPHLASRVFNTPLMIDSRKRTAILAALAPRMGIEPPAVEAALLAEQRSRKPYAITGGVAVIEVAGSLVNRAYGLEPQSGLTSYEQLGNEVLDAATDPGVKGILLRLDSYGGEANGAWDVADLIEEAARIKPVWASVDDWALSAGYLLASAASRIYVTRTGGVGSVGIIAMHLDQSGWDSDQGLQYTTVFEGARKNDFNPHEPLSDDARTTLQSEAARLYSMFVDAVARRRELSPVAVRGTEAGVLRGEDGIAAGLADRIGTFRQALGEMTSVVNQTRYSKGDTSVSEATQAAASAPAVDTPVDIHAIEAEARQQGYAEAAEIVELCGIAGQTALAGGFIAKRLTSRQVRGELLALRASADQEEIRSHVLPESGTRASQNVDENPVVKACLALATAKGGK